MMLMMMMPGCTAMTTATYEAHGDVYRSFMPTGSLKQQLLIPQIGFSCGDSVCAVLYYYSLVPEFEEVSFLADASLSMLSCNLYMKSRYSELEDITENSCIGRATLLESGTRMMTL
jgi:hypothetical protein